MQFGPFYIPTKALIPILIITAILSFLTINYVEPVGQTELSNMINDTKNPF